MGCASSLVKHVDDSKTEITTKHNQNAYNLRETRIIQEEQVDVYIDDEYDHIDDEWMHWSGNFEVVELRGEWKEGISAGGSRNDLELFATNPQFLLSVGRQEKHLNSVETEAQEENKQDRITVSVCLEQSGQKPLAHVAYFIYRTDKEERLSAEYFLVVPPEGDTGAFVNWRQVRHEFRLTPGLYVIVPATFKPNTVRPFCLTVQSVPPLILKLLTKSSQLL